MALGAQKIYKRQ